MLCFNCGAEIKIKKARKKNKKKNMEVLKCNCNSLVYDADSGVYHQNIIPERIISGKRMISKTLNSVIDWG